MSDVFSIFETERFIKDLEKDFSGHSEKIRKKMKEYVYPALRNQPFYGSNIKKLINYKPPTWRYRIGDFRFFYTIDTNKKTVFMLKLSNRKDAY